MTAAATISLVDLLPAMLPRWWTCEQTALDGGVPAIRYVYQVTARERPLVVLVTLDDMDDGVGVWLHSSTSRQGHLPSWNDLKLVHEIIHGDRPVVQLLPPRSSWLSIADCLHLFERLDRDTVPEALWRRR